MAVVLMVRITSAVDGEELQRRALERRPRFREIPGLIQKVYGRDPATGAFCGLYFFDNPASLQAFKETELAKTIPSAYEAQEVRKEIYEVLFPLYEDRGPLEKW